jgi:serine/threonine protein kinase
MQSGLATGTQTEGADRQPAAAPPPVEEIARLFPQFEVLELLGRGGMGAVYKVRQPQLDRLVALKILLRRLQDRDPDSAFAERFAREARALAKLNHPNIVAVYDYGQAGGYAFLLMEYVDGLTLRQLLQRGRLTPEEALGIVPQVCEALQFAHQQGVIHRDIKPENILLDKQGRVKIGDFGIAKMADPAAPEGLTQEQQVIGTPHYMAPEQVERPQTVDHRADIYSLGVVFYEMLTGELPLGKFAPPSHKSWADARLDQVVLHALEKEPERRYQQASEVKTDIETIAATPDEARAAMARSPRPQPTEPQADNASSPRRAVLLAGGFALAVVLAFMGLTALFKGTGSKATTTTRGVAGLSSSNAFWTLLNEDQRLVFQYTDREFYYLEDDRVFDGWPEPERAQLERRSIDALRGPHTREYFQAINTLAALRSTNALPALRKLACEPVDKLLRFEVSNRPRWMAARALGRIGDKSVVPDLIHLLYHHCPNVRWWAQIALVQLTGRDFGPDWNAWGEWWNSQKDQPPFHPETVRWSPEQAEPGPLAGVLAENDRKFLTGLRKHSPANPSPATSAEVIADSRDFSISGNGFTIETLKNGTRAFANRKYLWRDIPDNFVGRRYTQTSGGVEAHVSIHAKRDALLQVFTTAERAGVNLAGWEQTSTRFFYTDGKYTWMTLFEKKLASNEEIEIPQGNWSGVLVLLPD